MDAYEVDKYQWMHIVDAQGKTSLLILGYFSLKHVMYGYKCFNTLVVQENIFYN